MAVQGHSHHLERLHKELPPASLFVGPFSVGKWTVAEHLRWFYQIDPVDVLRVNELTTDAAEAVYEFTLTAPTASAFKLVIADLYKSTPLAQTALAFSLLNPRNARIIVVSTPADVIDAVRSLCIPFQFTYLSDEQLSNVLVQKMNFSPERAKSLAPAGRGQVAAALHVANSESVLNDVLAVVKALRIHDEELLLSYAQRWTDAHTRWLARWCEESASGRWFVFSPEDGVDSKSLPLRVLAALRQNVRPRLVVRSLLHRILRGE